MSIKVSYAQQFALRLGIHALLMMAKSLKSQEVILRNTGAFKKMTVNGEIKSGKSIIRLLDSFTEQALCGIKQDSEVLIHLEMFRLN